MNCQNRTFLSFYILTILGKSQFENASPKTIDFSGFKRCQKFFNFKKGGLNYILTILGKSQFVCKPL